MDSSGSNSKTSQQNRCTCKVKLALSVVYLKLYNRRRRVEPSQLAYRGVRVSLGVGAHAGHARTHFPTAAQSNSRSHLKGCQLSRLSLRAQPAPSSLFYSLTPRLQRSTHHSHWQVLRSLLLLNQSLEFWWRAAEPMGMLVEAAAGSEGREAVPGAGCGWGNQLPFGVRSRRRRRRRCLRWRGIRGERDTSRPFPPVPIPRSRGPGPPCSCWAIPRVQPCEAASGPRGCVIRTVAPLPCQRDARGGGGSGLLAAPAVTATPSTARRLGPLGVCFRSLPLPPSPRRRGCALGRGSRETPPPPRYPRPSPLHTRTHYRAGSHTLARLPLCASVSAGVVPGPRSHHVHCLLLLQFFSDPSSPAAEDAAQRRGLPARRPLRRQRERCGRRRGLRPGCGSRPAAAAHPRHGALPAPAGQPAQSHAPTRRRRRRLAGQPPGARRGPRPQPAQSDAAAGRSRGPDRAGAAGQGPPETVPREPPEEQLT